MIRVVIDGRIATLSLRRPPVNAFDEAQLARFASVLRDLRERDDIGAVLVRSETEHFSAGADVKALVSSLGDGSTDGVDRTTAFAASMQALWGELAELPLPTLAVIAGAATGGGLELAMACDLRVIGRSARVGLPEVRLGLLPAAGGTQRLTRLAGPGVAARLMLTGELIDAETALRLGLVEWVVDDEALDVCAREIAASIAHQSGPAMAEIKSCIAKAGSQAGFETEIEATGRLHRTPEASRRLREFVGADA
jgi:enoyl-CoA hydratase